MAYSVALGLHGKVKYVDPRGYGRCTCRNSRSYVDVPSLVDIQVGVIEVRLLLSAFHLHSGVAFARMLCVVCLSPTLYNVNAKPVNILVAWLRRKEILDVEQRRITTAPASALLGPGLDLDSTDRVCFLRRADLRNNGRLLALSQVS
jgi:hypothetical protein